MNTVFLHEGESRESLFRNKRFMLDEMFQQNASFATLLENKRPTKIFQICVSILTSFSHLINALV